MGCSAGQTPDSVHGRAGVSIACKTKACPGCNLRPTGGAAKVGPSADDPPERTTPDQSAFKVVRLRQGV